jgi:hypothetical protein
MLISAKGLWAKILKKRKEIFSALLKSKHDLRRSPRVILVKFMSNIKIIIWLRQWLCFLYCLFQPFHAYAQINTQEISVHRFCDFPLLLTLQIAILITMEKNSGRHIQIFKCLTYALLA